MCAIILFDQERWNSENKSHENSHYPNVKLDEITRRYGVDLQNALKTADDESTEQEQLYHKGALRELFESC